MYCMNCGKENPDDVKFCCFCGTPANAVSRSIEEISDKISENLAENGQLDIEDAAEISSAISEKIDEKPAENAPVNAEAKPANQQIPIPPVVPTAPVSSTAPVSRVAPADLVSNVSPVRNPMPSSPYGYPRSPYAHPQPQPINRQGVSPAANSAQSTPNVNVSTKSAVPEKNQDVVRTFTLKHIIMCLVSTAICAIAAGVFAGLYFSVI